MNIATYLYRQCLLRVKFPDRIQIGMRVAKIGNSSVQYELGVFANEQTEVSSLGVFVHVYVDRQTNRPVSIPEDVRALLTGLVSVCARGP